VKTFQIIISGQVQGVGFRPFVYDLAHKFQLKGLVCNNADGVFIHINSSEEESKKFLGEILKNAPKISVIQSHYIAEIDFKVYSDFRIVPSETNQQINIPLTPDFATCECCKTEIRDVNNRRFGYAFTTCTNCGPRYSVTTKFPFERANTTISDFDMCHTCQKEYINPNDRRFHSQTNSCTDCGIQMKLTKANEETIIATQSDIIQKAADFILNGNIIALKNTNGYVLCCDANNKETIKKLRERKQRLSKPFALLYPSIEKIKNDFEISREEEKALTSSIAPIVILNPKREIKNLEQQSIAPGLNQLGVMLPSSALLILLMDKLQKPIIATSGNIHGSPIISKESDVIQKLSEVADYFVHHNLEISFPQDDSVVRFAAELQITLRRSRGLAPNYLGVGQTKDEKVLAMGAHLKSTFTFVPNQHTYVSPYFGNLDNYEVLERFQDSIRHYDNLFQTKAETILIDAHPQYQSSILGKELADKWNAKLLHTQHHKAHFASVLGEHNLFESKDKILGVVWDGTGFGEDQAIWGGEFFSYENYTMERVNHFEYVDWLAGDKMAKEPRLSLLSMLPDTEKEVAKPKFSETEWKVYKRMLETNTLKTSSVGRLFDAVASLLDIKDITSYEGQAAMILENEARKSEEEICIDFLEGIRCEVIPTRILVSNILNAKNKGTPNPQIASSFIHTLALIIVKAAIENNYKIIACSGGVFQNAILVQKLSQLLKKQGIKLKINRILSSNDENISFGQLCYYQHIKN